MDSKISLSFLLIFCFSIFGRAQTTEHYDIQWYSISKIGNKSNHTYSISFENALGSERYEGLPAFYLQKALDSEYALDFKLANVQYTNVADSIVAHFPSMKKLGDSFELNSQVYSSSGDYYENTIIETFRKRNDTIEKLLSFDLIISKKKYLKKALIGNKGGSYASHSVFKSGQWYKIGLTKDGIYKIKGSDLVSMGFSLNSVPTDQIKVYGNGGGMLPERNSNYYPDDILENTIEIHDINNNGIFDNTDFLLFYGQGPNPWNYNKVTKRFSHTKHLYDDYSYYFITIDKNGGGKRIVKESVPSQSPSIFVNTFTDYAFHDNDSLNLIKSGRIWFGEEFNILQSRKFSFSFPFINPQSKVYIKANAIARSFTTSSMNYFINGATMTASFQPVYNHYLAAYATPSTDTITFKTSGSAININVVYNKPNSSSTAWLNYIEINAIRNLTMVGGQMNLRNVQCIGTGNISKFTIENVNNNTHIWDVTNITNPKIIESTINATTLNFKVSTDSLRNFVAHSGSYFAVKNIGAVTNQDLHEYVAVDYVILYNPKFKKEAEELADFHRNRSSLNILTVEAQTIYNEFSSGAKDISGIRNFMRMLYDKANGDQSLMPKYLLLFGDASYDYKNRINNNTNLVPTYESYESLSPTASFTTDDYFGLLDDNEGANANGNLDVGIGRFPITTNQQARAILNKIYRYTAQPGLDTTNSATCSNGNGGVSNLADWRNISCFIGDDEDNNTHLKQADYLANYVWSNYPVYNVDKIFFDAYPQIITPGGQRYPDVKAAIKNRVEKGALIINYTGHGGEEGWAHESVLEVSDINGWTNLNNMPAFVTATCEFSRYDDPERVSAGELVLLNPIGGGIALLTTSRVTYSSTNFQLSKIIYKNIFKKFNGKYLCLGDVMRLSKIGSGSVSANKNFVLLGDPALTLSYPLKDIKTTAILDANTQTSIDTLKALSKIKIEGEITENGSLMQSFNGYIYPTIYDKAQTYSTLGNDPESQVYNFKLQKNIIYKGKAKVKNGKFSFTFVVPKDISYQLGNGKLSYYSHNGEIDANGYYDSLIIGGSLSNPEVDTEGPEIRLFMNDSNFKVGGVTDQNPNLLAFVFDEHGINTVGNGIGHDIVATLDENSVDPIILNDFYESTLDDYKSGKVRYPFTNLSFGTHTLSIKVWDVYNNSSTAHTEFIVANGEEMVLNNLLNAPNPFTNRTSFIFEHNQSCDVMNVEIEIFNSMGQQVKIIKAEVNSTGYRVGAGQLSWNGTNDYGTKLPSGIYIYRVKAQNSDGNWIEKSNKMVILRSN